MQLPVLSFSTMLQRMAAGVQGSAAALLDLSVGSVVRAMLEACATVALWLQWMILQVLAATRAATSTGPDLDSWMADFLFARLAGAPATGSVTFSRYTSGLSVLIPVNTMVMTTDGTQTFAVAADPTNAAWDNGAYLLPAPLTSVTVPVAAVNAGSAGNVLAGMIGLIGSPVPGIDTASNALPLTGGLDAESDAAFRARFQVYINSRSLATVGAIQAAIGAISSVSRYAVLENQDSQGNPVAGMFHVVADDGSGAPSAPLLSEVQAAVDVVRPVGTIYSVSGPAVTFANVVVALETANPATQPVIATAVQAAIVNWIASLPLGGFLAISKIDALAHASDPAVLSVTSTLINGSAADLCVPAGGALIAQTVSVT